MAKGADFLAGNGVEAPYHRVEQGQHIPPGVELEHSAAVVHREGGPGGGQQAAGVEQAVRPRGAEQERRGQGGDDGRQGAQHRHVGGAGVDQGRVLKIVVEEDAQQAPQNVIPLCPPAQPAQGAGVDERGGQDGDGNTQEHQHSGTHRLQRYLGGHKGAAPDDDGTQRRKMSGTILPEQGHKTYLLSDAGAAGE